MSKVISISDEVYARMKPLTNDLGGRNIKKIGFSQVISNALDDQDRLKKRKIRK